MTILRISFEINSENMFYLGKLADKYFIDALLKEIRVPILQMSLI